VAGVVAGMALSGRAARRVAVDPEQAWDAGLFALLSCFAASRLLLVLDDPKAFLRFPFLVLSLPSLTIAGLIVAGLVTWLYLRRKRWPVFRLLDVFAPGGAVLAVFLELGHWLEGSKPGMPVFRGEAAMVVGYRPVALYGASVAAGVGVFLWWLLDREKSAGRVAAVGLMVGGLAAFALDLLSFPVDRFGELWLEPGQVMSLAGMLAGAALWTFAREPERKRLEEVN
jgi:phosphatidylglycerol---prolipoprotein diacylglyceryl transferase